MKKEEGFLRDPNKNSEAKEPGFICDNCGTCQHKSESHHAGSGKCYSCPPEKRCCKFVVQHDKEMVR